MQLKYSNDEKVFNIHTDEIPYLSVAMLDGLGVPNLYSTRLLSYDEESGRGSEGLRTALMKWEDKEEAAPHIAGMRDKLARQIGSSIEHECVTDQKHTNYVHVAKKEDIGLTWQEPRPLHLQYVDGIVSDIPDILLTAFGGDCPPVYLADPGRNAVGIVHAGWKGTLARIPAVAISQMVVHFGSDPKNIYAAIGPGVCRDCYEMGDEVYQAFASEWSRADADALLSKYPARDEKGCEIMGGKYHLDLFAANKLTLLRAGVQESHIAVSNLCTMCNSDIFYSYRAGRLENENAAMIVNRSKVR
ncbi:MAG: peptidoglycan editing factor PgeF [Mogibacterium sp.]|nr:peptidoglycan editing factor PgeF [Mogibacterium sp.]